MKLIINLTNLEMIDEKPEFNDGEEKEVQKEKIAIQKVLF